MPEDLNETKLENPAQGEKPPVVCRYLGGPDDLQTYFQFASSLNRCYRPSPIKTLSPTHQSEYCLSAKHASCPVFQENWDGNFPRDFLAMTHRGKSHRRSKTRQTGVGLDLRRRYGAMSTQQRGLLISMLVIMGVLAIVAAFGLRNSTVRARTFSFFRVMFGLGSGGAPAIVRFTPTPLQPAGTAEPFEAIIVAGTPAPTSQALASASPAPTAAPTILPTSTQFPTPGPGFKTPFGPDGTFLIHVVTAGESFNSIAVQYSTTPTVLQAINPVIEGASLWVGRQLVVAVGVIDASALPVFEVFFTTAPASLTDLAEAFGTDPESIRLYNQLGETDAIPSGRWLIIPLP